MQAQKIHYPDIKGSFGLTGLTILSLILFSPISFLFVELMGKEASMFIYYIIAAGLPFLFAKRRRKIKTGLNTFKLNFGSSKIMLFTILTILALVVGLISPITNLIPMTDQLKRLYLEFATNTGLFAYITVVIAAPILEEFLFRGIILDGLLRKYSVYTSIILSSFLFGLVHLNLWQFVAAFVIGCFAGWVYYKTRNLFLPILIHLTNNLFSFAGIYFTDIEALLNTSIKEMYNGYLNYALSIVVALSIALFCILKLKNEFEGLKVLPWK